MGNSSNAQIGAVQQEFKAKFKDGFKQFDLSKFKINKDARRKEAENVLGNHNENKPPPGYSRAKNGLNYSNVITLRLEQTSKKGFRDAAKTDNFREGLLVEGPYHHDVMGACFLAQFDAHGRPDGYGIMVTDKVDDQIGGDYYEGGFKEGKRHGIGLHIWNSDNFYFGNWEDDKPHGNGRMEWKTGVILNGGWKEGKPSGCIIVNIRKEGFEYHCYSDTNQSWKGTRIQKVPRLRFFTKEVHVECFGSITNNFVEMNIVNHYDAESRPVTEKKIDFYHQTELLTSQKTLKALKASTISP